MQLIQYTVYAEYWLSARSTILIHYFVVFHLQVQNFLFLSKLSEPMIFVVIASLSRWFPGAVFTLMHFSGAFALKGFRGKASAELIGRNERWPVMSSCSLWRSDTEVREVAANYCVIIQEKFMTVTSDCDNDIHEWLGWWCAAADTGEPLPASWYLWVFQKYLIVIWLSCLGLDIIGIWTILVPILVSHFNSSSQWLLIQDIGIRLWFRNRIKNVFMVQKR